MFCSESEAEAEGEGALMRMQSMLTKSTWLMKRNRPSSTWVAERYAFRKGDACQKREQSGGQVWVGGVASVGAKESRCLPRAERRACDAGRGAAGREAQEVAGDRGAHSVQGKAQLQIGSRARGGAHIKHVHDI